MLCVDIIGREILERNVISTVAEHRVTSRRVAYNFDSKHLHSLTNRVRFPTFADSIRLLADQDDPSRYDMASRGPAAIIKLTVRELVLATQVILRERFCVSLEPVRFNLVTRYTAKDGFRGSQYITYCSGSQTPQWKDN